MVQPERSHSTRSGPGWGCTRSTWQTTRLRCWTEGFFRLARSHPHSLPAFQPDQFESAENVVHCRDQVAVGGAEEPRLLHVGASSFMHQGATLFLWRCLRGQNPSSPAAVSADQPGGLQFTVGAGGGADGKSQV